MIRYPAFITGLGVGGAVGITIAIAVVVAGVIVMVVKGLKGGVKSSKLHPYIDVEYTDVENAGIPKQLKWETTNGPHRIAYRHVK